MPAAAGAYKPVKQHALLQRRQRVEIFQIPGAGVGLAALLRADLRRDLVESC